jgi:hypothetical protein
VNKEGVAHYDDLIATLVAAGIKPVVTLFHWGESISRQHPNSTKDYQIPLWRSSIPMAPGRMSES